MLFLLPRTPAASTLTTEEVRRPTKNRRDRQMTTPLTANDHDQPAFKGQPKTPGWDRRNNESGDP